MIDWEKTVLAPCVGVFGEPAVFMPKFGPPAPVDVIFDNAYKEITLSEYGTEVTTVYPAAGGSLSDFPSAPVQGDSLKILRNGKTYVIRKPRLDSHGGVFLVLNAS